MKKNIKKPAIAIALVGCMALVGISAYFTDADTKVNEFTIGAMKIDENNHGAKVEEPNWDPDKDYDGDGTPDASQVKPLQELPKDPQVFNGGNINEFVFMTVTIPTATVKTQELDGTVNDAALTELFSYKVNNGWVEVPSAKTIGTDTVTRVYAYSADGTNLTAVAPNTRTTALFDYIKFANVLEDQGLEGTAKNVVINAYTIQADNLGEASEFDGNNANGITDIEGVFDILNKTHA